MTLSNEQILELAKSCGLHDGMCDDRHWGIWRETVLKFALAIHENGYNKGYDRGYEEGWESSKVSTEMNTWSDEE